ncbi:hypothetical protein LRS03_05470 [Rhizobacter sp. J219]|uniref:hypothetical protein n=1 Tax=Rhizobacter sp. J219 TaxID=2898430 RepID=UPI002151CFAB|nr:hypothetical protein [Rhizobacter sp. J219]MCR5882336.1 hypothetical protein [Rhizobacter sp. J219]
MRRWLLLLMIALIPLRGLAGELVVVEVSINATLYEASQAAPAQAMPADCPMHTGDSAQNCTACGLCVPMAEPASISLQTANAAVHEQPFAPRAAFHSASLAPAVEPPIS